MAYFKDLTVHTYTLHDQAEPNVFNVGWLGHPFFRRGRTTAEFRAKLQHLCEHPIFLHGGFHQCPFCWRGWFGNYRFWQRHGNGQIRVQGKTGRWYAAPIMIHHYVTRHSYRPPKEFIATVLSPQAVAVDPDELRWRSRFHERSTH
jgi:hypothetical protein